MIDIYDLYESSVQDPEVELKFLLRVYGRFFKKAPLNFREDFSGTFLNCVEWVRRNPLRKAVAVDKSKDALSFGKKRHLVKLNSSDQKRVTIVEKDVASYVSATKMDMIAALNFSIGYMYSRDQLIKYFRNAYRSLGTKGLFFVDLLGGHEVESYTHERRVCYSEKYGKFWYIWEQNGFEPVQRRVQFSISFEMPKGKKMKNAFTYDWRLWTIPDLREAMKEAGFKKTHVYWEGSNSKGSGTGIFRPTEKAENCEVWIAYVVGEK